MKRFFNFILTLFLGLILGFWINENHLLGDNVLNSGLTMVAQTLNPKNLGNPETITGQTATSSTGQKIRMQDGSLATVPDPDSIDLELLEELIFEKINVLRADLGLGLLASNDTLKQAAHLRAEESAITFSHTRPDGRDTFSVLNQEFSYPYQVVGENLGKATLVNDEEFMAEWLMQGWIDSPDHYEAMVNGQFAEVGVGAYIEDDILYATQLFGTPLY